MLCLIFSFIKKELNKYNQRFNLYKSKFINFRTNPALFTTTMNKRNSMRNLEVFFDQKNNIDTSLLSKTPNFSNCFNKACENKSKLNYDLKRTIFNDISINLFNFCIISI